MVHQKVTLNWAYEHYLVYLHLCIADSDCMICENEFDQIKKTAFPAIDASRAGQLIKEVYLEFLSHNELEKKSNIMNFAPKFLRTEFVKKKVIDNLEKIVRKDEECEEQQMFKYIRRVIFSLK